MHWNRKISLLAISFALVFVLLSTAPQVTVEQHVAPDSPIADYIVSATLAPPDLVAFWQMNEGSGPEAVEMIEPMINNGHLMAPYSWVTGVVGTGLQFDRGGWADCGVNNPRLILTNDLTLEAWINISNFLPGEVQTIIENRYALNPKVFQFGVMNGYLFYDRYNPGGEVLSLTRLETGKWHHVAVVVSRTQQEVTFYIDGQGESPVFYNDGVYGGAGFVHLGVETPPPTGPSFYYQGSMDEVAVWSRLLPADEINEHYQKGLRGLSYLDDLPANTAPVAEDDEYTLDEDMPLIVGPPGVMANDYDYDDDPLEVIPVSGTSHGSLSLSPDGAIDYIPDPDYFGPDSFTYQVFDGEDYSDAATVSLTIQPVNDAPVAVDDAYSIDEDEGLYIDAPGVLTNDMDVEGDPLQAVLLSMPDTHEPGDTGWAFLSDGAFHYVPKPDWHGTTSFTYQVYDGVAYSNIVTVTITVNSVNDVPVAVDDAYSIDEDEGLYIDAPGVLANDMDVEGDPLQAILLSMPDTHEPGDTGWAFLSDGAFHYVPKPDWHGTTSFTYQVYDGVAYSNIVTVTITVNPVNDAPVANDDAYTADEGVTLLIPSPGVLGNDVDDSVSLTAELVDSPAFGTLTLNSDGSFGYYVTGFSGIVTFTYQVYDGEIFSNTATVTLDVIADTTPPATLIALSGTMGLNNWFISDVTVTFTADEASSTAYSINNGPWISYIGPFVVFLEGTVVVCYNSTDLVGNREVTQTTSFMVDKTPPDIKLSIEPVPGQGILVTLTATETGSGLIDVGYNLDGGRWVRYSDPVRLTQEGLVTFNYRAKDLAGNLVVKEEIIDVIIPPDIIPPDLTYTGDLTGEYSDPVYLEARLTDTQTGLPIEGKLLVFTLGPLTFDAMTDSSGIASFVLVLDLPSDTYSLLVSFAGDDAYTETSITHEFFVAKEYAYAEYTGRTVIPTSDDSLTLMATIFDEDDGYWGDLTRIYVTFSLYLDSGLVFETGPIMVETTDVDGVGIAIAEIENLDEGNYIVVVRFNSLDNSYYYGPDSETGVTIYVPEREFAHGAGFIRNEDGRRVFFVFHAKYSCKGKLKGFLLLTYREHEWAYVIRSTEILGMTVDGNHGIIEGSVRIFKFNLKTWEKVCSEEELRFRIDAWDNKNSDEYEDDVFQIRIHDSIGLVVYELGFEPFGLLVRGNIKVRDHRH